MNFASILQKSARLAHRAGRVQIKDTAPVSTAINRAFTSQTRLFSCSDKSATGSTETSLLQSIQLESQQWSANIHHPQVDKVFGVSPDEFPFNIKDENSTIILTREYGGESIRVELSIHDDCDCDCDCDENKDQVPFTVFTSKKGQVTWEFHCTAKLNEISISHILRKTQQPDEQPGHYFSDLMGEKLKKDVVEYLEKRGINSSTTNFIFKYVYKRECRKYVEWLNNLKNYVEA